MGIIIIMIIIIIIITNNNNLYFKRVTPSNTRFDFRYGPQI